MPLTRLPEPGIGGEPGGIYPIRPCCMLSDAPDGAGFIGIAGVMPWTLSGGGNGGAGMPPPEKVTPEFT